MPALKTYDLFISHAWKYGYEYDKLVNLLDNAPNFYYRNYSAPSEKPLSNLDGSPVNTSKEIKDAVEAKTVEKVEILPYHDLGKFKWKELGFDYPLDKTKPATSEDIAKASKILGLT